MFNSCGKRKATEETVPFVSPAKKVKLAALPVVPSEKAIDLDEEDIDEVEVVEEPEVFDKKKGTSTGRQVGTPGYTTAEHEALMNIVVDMDLFKKVSLEKAENWRIVSNKLETVTGINRASKCLCSHFADMMSMVRSAMASTQRNTDEIDALYADRVKIVLCESKAVGKSRPKWWNAGIVLQMISGINAADASRINISSSSMGGKETVVSIYYGKYMSRIIYC